MNGIFRKAYTYFGNFHPRMKEWVSGQFGSRDRLWTCKPTRSPICKHPSQLQDNLDTGVGRGDCKVATPACAQARPSAPAISAGRSGRTRTPLPAAQRPAKVTPAPPVGSQTPAQPGVDLPHRRAGARRALAGTRIQHRTPTERHAWPCRLQ